MNDALLKTLTLLLLIVIGMVLRPKFKGKDEVNGIKQMVLTVALPATIFVALMKINVDSKLIIVPILTLVFNFFMYFVSPIVLNFFHIGKDTTTGRTLMMLLPSLAPGLSCFPFISEFLGEESLAMAAMADVGNKFFVLIFLYIIAMNMFLKNNESEESNMRDKIKSLLLSLVQEPINIVLFVAFLLLAFGFNYKSLPSLAQEIFDKTSAMMTPLVLMFIGLAVQLKEGKKRVVVSVLFIRAGLSLLFSSIIIAVFGISKSTDVLLAVAIPLSSASFWPFAHISAFHLKEEVKKVAKEKRTFDLELAVLVLAFSLPFSTILILGILSAGTLFTHLPAIIITGIVLVVLGSIPLLVRRPVLQLSKVTRQS